MTVRITPSPARGTVAAPPSKSVLHRALISAFLAGGGRIKNAALSEDVLATLDCIAALGGKYEINGDEIVISEANYANAENAVLPCRESGSTLRFFIPIVLALGRHATFTGAEKLLSRPLSVYEDICKENGFTFVKNKDEIRVSGKLKPGVYEIPGDISSQFITGMIFGLSMVREKSEIRLIPPISSRPYIDLTLQNAEKFGIFARFTDENTIEIHGGTFSPCDIEVEGDYSNAAFLDCLNYLGGSVTVTGLEEDSLQGDKKYIGFFEQLKNGAPVIDIEDTPDLGPVLFCLAAEQNGATFTGTKRLKIKESDRAEAVKTELAKLGGRMDVFEDSVVVYKSELHSPDSPLYGHNDHRIVMAFACLLSKYGGEIEGAEAVKKSFPDFFEKIGALGVETTVII